MHWMFRLSESVGLRISPVSSTAPCSLLMAAVIWPTSWSDCPEQPHRSWTNPRHRPKPKKSCCCEFTLLSVGTQQITYIRNRRSNEWRFLRMLQAISGDRLACLLLELRLRGKSTRQSHGTSIFYVDIMVCSWLSLEDAVLIKLVGGFCLQPIGEAARRSVISISLDWLPVMYLTQPPFRLFLFGLFVQLISPGQDLMVQSLMPPSRCNEPDGSFVF